MHILSIHIGSYSVKSAEIMTGFRRVELVDFFEYVYSDSATTKELKLFEANQYIKRLIQGLDKKPEKIVTSIPASSLSMHFYLLPIKSVSKAQQMYLYELEDRVPFSLDQTCIEKVFFKQKTSLLVAAGIVPRSCVAQKIMEFEDTLLDPDWLSFDGMGAINSYFVQPRSKEDPFPKESQLLVNIGHEHTLISVVRGKTLQFFRQVSWGGNRINKVIADHFDLSLNEADEYKKNITNWEDKELFEGVKKEILSLNAELQHSIVAYRTQVSEEVTSVLLEGGGSLLQGLDEWLAQFLKIPVRLQYSLDGVIQHSDWDSHMAFRFNECYGNALVFQRKAPFLFNFRKDDFAKETSINEFGKVIKDPQSISYLKWGALIFLMFVFHSFLALTFVTKELNMTKTELSQNVKSVFHTLPKRMRDKFASEPKDLQAFVDKKNKEMDQKLKLIKVRPETALGILNTISDSFPRDVRVDVTHYSLHQNQLTIKATYHSGDTQVLEESLKKLSHFEDWNIKLEDKNLLIQAKHQGRSS